MATNKANVVPTLMSSLSMDVLEKLGMKLNPRHPLKDFRYLAGKMNYTYESVRNFERQKNPTVFLLSEWWMSSAEKGEQKTVTNLIEYLQEMRRDDAVELLRPVEFTGKNPVVHRQKLCKPINLIVCSILVCVSRHVRACFFVETMCYRFGSSSK